MLIYLCKTEGKNTPMDIARFFRISKAMATNMVTAMHKQGYVEKRGLPDDRRSSMIVPTEKARVLVEGTYEEYYKTMRVLSDKLGDKDFAALLTLLEQANAILIEEKGNG